MKITCLRAMLPKSVIEKCSKFSKNEPVNSRAFFSECASMQDVKLVPITEQISNSRNVDFFNPTTPINIEAKAKAKNINFIF